MSARSHALLQRMLLTLPFTSFIGLAVASDPAVELAPLRYKYLEIVRNRELAKNHRIYHPTLTLDNHAKELICWWILNIDFQTRSQQMLV